MKYLTIINNQQFEVEIHSDGSLTLNGQPHEVDFLAIGASRYSIIKDFRSLELVIEDSDEGGYDILLGGRRYTGQVLDERALLMANRKGGVKGGTNEVHSPMPGLIVQVTVGIGDSVQEGQTVVILESMKMQNELKAPRSGIIENIHIQQGQTVDKGALLIYIGDLKE
jgi:biotin carboxyl carrier protein